MYVWVCACHVCGYGDNTKALYPSYLEGPPVSSVVVFPHSPPCEFLRLALPPTPLETYQRVPFKYKMHSPSRGDSGKRDVLHLTAFQWHSDSSYRLQSWANVPLSRLIICLWLPFLKIECFILFPVNNETLPVD